MPFTVGYVTLLWNQQEQETAMRAALVDAGQQCPPDETWLASVYDVAGENRKPGFRSGLAIGTTLILRGSREKDTLTSGWTSEGHDGPSFIYTRTSNSAEHESEAAWIDREFRRAVVEFLRLP
jgi:hypothetical protein